MAVAIAKQSQACSEAQLIDDMLAEWGVSVRRACKGLKFDISTCHYKSRRTGQVGFEQRIGSARRSMSASAWNAVSLSQRWTTGRP